MTSVAILSVPYVNSPSVQRDFDDFASKFNVKYPASLLGAAKVSTPELESLRRSLDCDEIRNDVLLASNYHYRHLLHEIVLFAGRPQEKAGSIRELKLFYTLKEVLIFIVSLKESARKSQTLQTVYSWYLNQCQFLGILSHVASKSVRAKAGSRFGGVGRVPVKKFKDYSARSIRFSTLRSLSRVQTRDLFSSHAERSGKSTETIVNEVKARRYAPRDDSLLLEIDQQKRRQTFAVAELPRSHSSTFLLSSNMNTDSRTAQVHQDLDRIWREKRQQDSDQRRFKAHTRALLEKWSSDRSRFDEEIVRRQEAFLFKQLRMKSVNNDTTSKPSYGVEGVEHFDAQAFSGTKSWNLDVARNEIISLASEDPDQQKRTRIGTDPTGHIAKMASLPALKWDIDRSDVPTPLQLIEQRPGSTRALFQPELASLRMNLSPYKGVGRGQQQQLLHRQEAHLQRRADLLQVDRIKIEMTRHGMVLGRATLEKALVQPIPGLSELERTTMLPEAGEGLLINPFTSESGAKKGKNVKTKKGKKGKKSKKK